MTVRYPRQAGRFYADSVDSLKRQIEECFTHKLGPGRIPSPSGDLLTKLIALVSPHAGYLFSGPVAAHGFSLAAQNGRPDSVVVLGPNHTGRGSGVSIMTEGVWKTPLGDVEINSELAEEIQEQSHLIDIDKDAHMFEHSIEVQLPFLQYIYGEFPKLVPICMMLQDLSTSRDVGIAVANASMGSNVLIMASTDLTHYELQQVAQARDRAIIDAILRLDEEELQSKVETLNVSMCGYGPVSAVIIASKILGAGKVELLSYQTSGDITQDYSQVVGYCSIAISQS